jgi:hypothetical protein
MPAPREYKPGAVIRVNACGLPLWRLADHIADERARLPRRLDCRVHYTEGNGNYLTAVFLRVFKRRATYNDTIAANRQATYAATSIPPSCL